MRLDQEFTVDAPADRVWTFLMDVPRMATCIPGAGDVRQIDDRTYDATVKTKIGPIAASFGCKIAILDLDESAHAGVVEVNGKDTKIGGGVKARLTMSLVPDGDATTVRIGSDVDILGKIGQYGHGMISKRATAMLDEFAQCLRTQLAT
jgi:carbon monoxide dehydrogenase subunit G